MRMKKKDRASDNCIQWRLSRGWREAMGMLSWHLTSNKGNTGDALANVRVTNRLGPWQLAHNTTRGLTPGRKDPRVSRDAPGNWVPWPTSKGGKDWGKAQATSFTDKIRKKPGPRKAKEPSNAEAGDQDLDEQPEEDVLEDETDDETTEQSTSSDSAHSHPSSSASGRMGTRTGLQHLQIPPQGAGPQYGSIASLTQHRTSQATQDGTFGVRQQGYTNYHHPHSQPSAPRPAPPSKPLLQRFPNSSHESHQATRPSSDISHNVPNRGAKRQVNELDVEEDSPAQQHAKKPRVQQPQANGAFPTAAEIFTGMPNGTAMLNKHKAEYPHLYTQEAMQERKERLQIPDMSTAAFIEEMRKKHVTGRTDYAQPTEASQDRNTASPYQPSVSESRNLPGSAGGHGVRNAGRIAPQSRHGINELPSIEQQNIWSTPPVASTTSTVPDAQDSQSNVALLTRVPETRGPLRSVPSMVGTKRQYGSLDTDSAMTTSQQAKKARPPSSQNTNPVNLSAEANAETVNNENESHTKRRMISTASSQPFSYLGPNHTVRPVQRNAQGQNFVNSAGPSTPSSSDGIESSLSQRVPRLPSAGYYSIPVPGPGDDSGAPLNAYQQAYIDSQNQIGGAHSYINPAVLSNSIPSNATPAAESSNPKTESQVAGAGVTTSTGASDEDFNFNVLDPNFYIEDSTFPDFLVSSTTQSQPGDVDEGPMTALLNGDDLEFDFKMPEMDSNGDI